MAALQVCRPSGRMRIMISGVRAGMRVVRQAQRGGVITGVSTKTRDNTLLTPIDIASGLAIRKVLKPLGYPINDEDLGALAGKKKCSRFVFKVDPLDGTGAVATGAITSTVCVALYNLELRQVVAVVVGEPATGRILFAEVGTGAWMFYFNGSYEKGIATAKRCQVSPRTLKGDSFVYFDNYRDFARKEADIPKISNETLVRLYGDLFAGPNGCTVYHHSGSCLHHALVAVGQERMVGALSLCPSASFDVATVLLVLEAGGVAQGYSTKGGVLRKVDPRDIEAANFMISANNNETLAHLCKAFEHRINDYLDRLHAA